jgi:hypothetical protein
VNYREHGEEIREGSYEPYRCADCNCSVNEPDLTHLRRQLVDVRAERDALREALTPSPETKGAYIGEFSFRVELSDEDGDRYSQEFYVPWTTIKEIMAAITKRATPTRPPGEPDK